jgi:hypothetical protein
MNNVFWRLWSLLFPSCCGFALAVFYIWLPAATCGSQDAECLARAWAAWIVGCYLFAAIAIALRLDRWVFRGSQKPAVDETVRHPFLKWHTPD